MDAPRAKEIADMDVALFSAKRTCFLSTYYGFEMGPLAPAAVPWDEMVSRLGFGDYRQI